MPDTYTNFSELKQNEIENKDYAILHRSASSKIVVIAPHGGGIEPGTAEIADALAAGDYAFYAFKGLKQAGNSVLHIGSHRFDEPLGLQAVKHAAIALSIHGSRAQSEMIGIGGRHKGLKHYILESLLSAKFHAVISEAAGLRGIHPDNICNRCETGKGVQLEVSQGMRKKLFDRADGIPLRSRTFIFHRLIKAVRAAMAMFENDCAGLYP